MYNLAHCCIIGQDTSTNFQYSQFWFLHDGLTKIFNNFFKHFACPMHCTPLLYFIFAKPSRPRAFLQATVGEKTCKKNNRSKLQLHNVETDMRYLYQVLDQCSRPCQQQRETKTERARRACLIMIRLSADNTMWVAVNHCGHRYMRRAPACCLLQSSMQYPISPVLITEAMPDNYTTIVFRFEIAILVKSFRSLHHIGNNPGRSAI